MFPTFPDFIKLDLNHKDMYEEFVHELPPYSDISFTTLHIWWNLNGELSVSTLNGNLIIGYRLPFDQLNSGYSLVGTHDIDVSLVTVLDYLGEKDLTKRLVHVPEFVIKQIAHPENFHLEEEIDYNEYIFDSQGLATLEGSLYGRIRRDMNHFYREVDGKLLETRALDISSENTRGQLLEAIQRWGASRPAKNDPDNTEFQAIQRTLEHASLFDIQSLGLYIDGELHATTLFHKTRDQQYFIGHHMKTNPEIPGLFDYMMHQIARKALQDGVPFINAEMDLGIEGLRMHKMRLRPIDFLRKYTITVNQELLLAEPLSVIHNTSL
jgi:hypothetical protein